MKISIIGSGNIATFFAFKFHEAGHSIIQVISAHSEHARELADQYHASFGTAIQDVDTDADVCLLAVKDDIIDTILSQTDFSKKTIIHTAGSVTLKHLAAASENIGCIWCMYSVNKNHLPDRSNIPLIINASNGHTMEIVKTLANTINHSVYILSDEQKLTAHLAAVFANNFANHLFTIGQDILQRERIPFELLIPLIENTVEKLTYTAPDKLQTGPAIRHDAHTIARHEELLKDHEDYKNIYSLLTESIQKKYGG